jgi:hypothetical protein
VVTAPTSIAGISVTQSPTARSNQFFVCGPGVVTGAATAVLGDAGAADVDEVEV